ncbi:flagellar basal-body rod protein FlgF [Roseomonas sp. GC11]|uniref:flagellar basal-body rod protein FlgF n=1 Tax=Roseomonas sp. GC11 TaxID=2950546 RepID=UPI00210A3F21|nr:flagellar basal-body rod protein FlgF [Roseomonas sp. GC11]MCQ4161695.1 flagellar basal-body rod protein FlgF [Roseomonas sp. GC11]
MDSPSIVGLSGQLALRQQLDVVANNLANANTNGYRGDRTLFQTYVNKLNVPGREIAFVQDRATYIENRQGAISSTGNPLDLAIDGEAFFAVQRPGGQPGYTRDGRFKVSPEGTLVDGQGRAVLGEGGAPIRFPDRVTAVEIRANGNILVTNEGRVEQAGRVAVYSGGDMRGLRKAGDGLFDFPANTAQPVDLDSPDNRVRLVQGSLEASTVQPVTELANLTLLQRSYEGIQRIIADDDSRIRRLIETLGRPN